MVKVARYNMAATVVTYMYTITHTHTHMHKHLTGDLVPAAVSTKWQLTDSSADD